MSASDEKTAFHIVEPGDRLSRIASTRGYASAAVIWDHPPNDDLKKRRKNPEILMPGDKVFLPPKVPDVFDVPEKKETRFCLAAIPSELRIKLDLPADQPIKGKVRVFIDTEPYSPEAPYDGEVSAAGGVVKFHIDPRVSEVDLSCEDPAFAMRLLVGHLQPLEEPKGRGVEQRLNNVGFHCPLPPGGTSEDAEKERPRKLSARAQHALGRFQAAASPEEVAEVTGEPAPEEEKSEERRYGVLDEATLGRLAEKSAT